MKPSYVSYDPRTKNEPKSCDYCGRVVAKTIGFNLGKRKRFCNLFCLFKAHGYIFLITGVLLAAFGYFAYGFYSSVLLEPYSSFAAIREVQELNKSMARDNIGYTLIIFLVGLFQVGIGLLALILRLMQPPVPVRGK